MKKLFWTGFATFLVLVPKLVGAQGTTATSLRLDNPLGTINGPGDLYGRVIRNFLVPALGTSALVIFAYAGYLMITSQGNEEKAKKGQQAMFWAAVGLGVAFMSYIAVNFFVSALTESSLPPAG